MIIVFSIGTSVYIDKKWEQFHRSCILLRFWKLEVVICLVHVSVFTKSVCTDFTELEMDQQ
jgi:hypothetical protein